MLLAGQNAIDWRCAQRLPSAGVTGKMAAGNCFFQNTDTYVPSPKRGSYQSYQMFSFHASNGGEGALVAAGAKPLIPLNIELT